jgi:HD-GYP domain-containing protein (c-di-GMP phosphodiesterase class II)
MRIVPVNCITDETVLAKTIHNASGNILLRKGTTITASLLEKIKAADIHTIYIDDGYSSVEIEDIVKPELRYKAVKTIKETFKNIENDLKKSLTPDKKLRDKLQKKVMSKYVDNLKGIADSIIEDILKSHHLMVNVIDIKHLGEYTYEHSLNVAILSLIVGIELRLNKHELFALFTGAILHDIGKVFLDQEILDVGDGINPEDLAIYETHAEQGYNYLKENKGFAATAKIIILQHHEHVDGTGYPHGTHDESIHKNARIVAICNTYDKMTSDSKNSPAVPANEAIEYIMGNAGTKFDFDIVNTFVHKINPYPIGTLVDLSNHRTAVVVETNVDFPLRPIVQVLEVVNKEVKKRELIDLLHITDITIKRIRFKDILNQED